MIVIENLAKILAKIPLDVWNRIVDNEPEKRYMKNFLKLYGFGRFAVLMVAAGLNDFQLKGKADIAYWPILKDIIERNKVPSSLKEMNSILAEFYSKERLASLKLDRLNRFLTSTLAKELWTTKPEKVAEDFLQIWYNLAATMGQNKNAETIVFAMKCLGIALIIAGEYNFKVEQIPIPVDYRVRIFTERLGIDIKTDNDVRRFWSKVLEELRKYLPINMIHLDSLVWQIGTISKEDIIKYFRDLGVEPVGKELVRILA